MASSAAQRFSALEAEYDKALAQLEADHASEKLALQQKFIVDLGEAQSEALKHGDLDDANALQAKVVELRTSILTLRFSSTEWSLEYLEKKMPYTKTLFLPKGVCETHRGSSKWVTKWWISAEGDLIYTSGGGKLHTFPKPKPIGSIDGSFPGIGKLRLVFKKQL